MFCALLLLTPYLSVAACPQWMTWARAVTHGGGGHKTTPLGALVVTPGAGGGGNGRTSDPPPLGAALGTGPPTR